MKALFRIFFLLTVYSHVLGQENTFKGDSLLQLPQMPDSLKSQWQHVDSIRSDFNNQAQNIQGEYQKTISAIDGEQASLNHEIDSLNNLKLPTGHLTKRLDSLQMKRTEASTKLNSKLSDLKTKTTGKLDKIELTPEMQGPVNELKGKMNAVNLADNGPVKIPEIDVPGFKIPEANAGSLKDIQGLSQIETPLGEVGELTGELQNVGADVKTLASGDVANIENLSTVEQQAQNIDGIKELQEGNGAIDGYKEQLGDLSNPDAAKDKVVETARKQAINHFAGKEEVLQAAMDKMSKYKKYYSDVSSLADLPKRPPNAMKGKPFIERLVPGVYFQYQHKNAYILDVNPYAGYRISGRFTAGLGWNQRFVLSEKSNINESNYRIFGPRAFVDAKLGKGFVAHLESEYMNTFVPSRLTGTPDAGKYEWVSSTMIGLKKEYRIYKNLQGTVLMQYNLYNPYFKAPYVDRLNSRIGFEYLLKKKKKDTANGN